MSFTKADAIIGKITEPLISAILRVEDAIAIDEKFVKLDFWGAKK